MKTTDKNIQILIKILEPLLGVRLLKQVLCVILLIFEVDEQKIIKRLNISYNTVKKYANLLRNDKLSELFIDNKYRPTSEMETYKGEILDALDKNPARTLREAAVIIEQVTGLKRSLPQVRDFLKKTVTDRLK